METEEKCIELRVSYPGAVVSVIGEGCLTGNFKKLENPFPRRYERLSDGKEQHVHMLPEYDLTYEIEEVVDGKRVRWYCATLEGSADIYRISQYGAKVYARREIPLCDVVREYPERPSLVDFQDEEN
ncbi:MAG TPA: hypothetical protein VG844_10750 [Terracidiphilus sp.]|nr:hypothetical protein [Terracidiphilus sp.]